MTQLSPPAPRARHRETGRGGAAESQDARPWPSVFPALVVALLSAAALVFLLLTDPPAVTVGVALGVLAVGVALVLFVAAHRDRESARRMSQRLADLRSLAAHGQNELRTVIDQVQRGERPTPRPADAPPAEDGDQFGLLAREIRLGQQAAHDAVLQVASGAPAGSAPDQRVEVFVNLARRMQSLVHREIQLLDDLEAQVEDPDLLKGLFTVDHLATRLRRQSESLAVLGGASSRRQWTRPVGMHEVLRAAVAEVEQYSRVKVVPPVEGTLDGGAVADVIHLVAELVENATKFSAPQTQVLLRAQHVTAGLAVEVEDRGLGMMPADQQRVNELLADPGRINLNALLRDGRIGLFVVSSLARRHGIRVQLQTNIYGGTQAVVVLPRRMVDAGATSNTAEHQRQTAQPHRQPEPALVAQTQVAGAPAPAVGAAPTAAVPPATTAVPPATTAVPPATTAVPPATAAVPPAVVPGAVGGNGQAVTPTGGQYAEDGRPAVDEQRPGLPVREPGGWRAEWDAVQPPASPPLAVPPTVVPAAPAHAVAATPAVPSPHPAPAPAPQHPDLGYGPGSGPNSGPVVRESGERPPLPQRQVQSHLAPQLREAPTHRLDDPADEYDTGLMAAFQGGVSRAEEEAEDGPAGDGDRAR